MAVPANTTQTYAVKGIREDLSGVVYDLSPEDTPFFSRCKKVKAEQTNHEWMTDALRKSGDNAHIEGDDSTALPRAAGVRLGNYTQIFKDPVSVSGTTQAVNSVADLGKMAHEMVKVGKEQKLDIEKALFANQAKVAGSSTVARRLAGAPAWIKTNVSMASAGSPANPTGDGSDARTDGTAIAFSQTRFDTVMQQIWTSGGKPDSVYLSPVQMTKALGFVGNNNQRNTTQVNKVQNVLDIYVTPWGTVEFVPSRENRSRDVFIMQSDMWSVAELRPMKQEPLAKTGDSEKRHVITELTLEANNEIGSGIVADNTAT